MFDAVPLRILLVTLAGWVNRHQLEVIEYLREENRVLKEHLGGRRLRLTDAQRRRLAVNGHRLGRQGLRAVATLVTPDTILRWHRQLIARKWTRERRRVGRPGVRREIRHLSVRMARENPTWGYRRTAGTAVDPAVALPVTCSASLYAPNSRTRRRGPPRRDRSCHRCRRTRSCP